MKRVLTSIILGLFLISLVAAVQYNDVQIEEIKEQFVGNAQERAELMKELVNSTAEDRERIMAQIKENTQSRNQIRDEVAASIRSRIQEGQELMLENQKLRIKEINEEILELRTEKNKIIRTRFNLTEDIENKSRLRVQLSNGRNAEIKIMPETASTRALERLRLKNCNEERNCTIELKEVGNGSQTRAVYEAKAQKQFRIFGLFKNKEEVMTQIDAETGEEIFTKRPWWAWMASEETEVEL